MAAQEPRFIDDPNATILYADMHSGCFNVQGIVRITLENHVIDHGQNPGPLSRVVTARLNMPIAAAETMAKGILEMIERSRTTQSAQAQNVSKLN